MTTKYNQDVLYANGAFMGVDKAPLIRSSVEQANGGSVLDNAVQITQAEYNLLPVKDPKTLYLISN